MSEGASVDDALIIPFSTDALTAKLIGRIGASTEAQKLGQLITQSQKIRKSDQAVPAAILEKFHQAMIFIVRSLPPLE